MIIDIIHIEFSNIYIYIYIMDPYIEWKNNMTYELGVDENIINIIYEYIQRHNIKCGCTSTLLNCINSNTDIPIEYYDYFNIYQKILQSQYLSDTNNVINPDVTAHLDYKLSQDNTTKKLNICDHCGCSELSCNTSNHKYVSSDINTK